MYEIELKAHLDFNLFKTIKEKIEAQKEIRYLGYFEKSDIYYANQSGEVLFRLREEVGQKGTSFLVTIKDKKIIEKGEINNEVEFSVSDSEKFKQFAKMLDYSEYIRKIKKTHLFQFQDIKIEMNYIEQLGYYIELEILTEESSFNHQQELQVKLLEFLQSYQVPKELIQTEYYFQLLEKANCEAQH